LEVNDQGVSAFVVGLLSRMHRPGRSRRINIGIDLDFEATKGLFAAAASTRSGARRN